MEMLYSIVTWKPVSFWATLFLSSFCFHLSLLTHPQCINGSKTMPEYFSQVVADCDCLWWLLDSYFPQLQQNYAMGIQGSEESYATGIS